MKDKKIDNPVLLDTHVIIWALLKPDEISQTVKNIISTAQSSNMLLVSSISLWEIAMLRSRGYLPIPAKRYIREYMPLIPSMLDLNLPQKKSNRFF